MSISDEAAERARRKAHDLLDRGKGKEPDWLSERDKQRRAEATKTERLRELRLAKEAADRPAAKPPTARRPRKR